MIKKTIFHNQPYFCNEELQILKNVTRSLQLVRGEQIRQFENEFCDFLKIKRGHAVAVSSGSAALYLALWALEAKGKKIALPSYVCTALYHAIKLANGIPEFHDVEKESGNLSFNSVKNSRAKIAIIPHLYGIPSDIEKFSKFQVIEDCCQSLGAKVRGVSTGLLGVLGVFSFYATKLITTLGHGGMVVSNDKYKIDQIRDYIYFDEKNDGIPRFNFQMTEAQAAMGRVQLKKLPQFLKRRVWIYQQYLKSKIPLLGQDLDVKHYQAVRYRAVWQTTQVKSWMKKLSTYQIKSIIPIREDELMGEKKAFPNALYLSRNSLSLPIYPALKNSELKRILEVIKS